MEQPHGHVEQSHGHASITDVARRAGVSTSTVSRSLRGLPHVSEATRQRVLHAAADLSYVVDPTASRLASGRTGANRTGSVGVVVPFVTRWYFATVVAGAESVLREAGHEVLLYNLRDVAGRDQFFDRLPLRRRVDAVLVLCLSLGARERNALERLGVPVLVVGASEDVAARPEEALAPASSTNSRAPGNGRTRRRFTSVHIDDTAGAMIAVRHLVNLGHERIAMICGSDDGHDFTAPLDRRDGYEKVVAEAGLPDDPENVVAAPWGFEGGVRAMEQLLSSPDLPTAIFCESDEMAFGALRTLRRAGLRVPADVSLVGFDDHEFASVVDLTTVAQPVHEIGEIAATLLLEALGPRAGDIADVTLPTRLVVRGSTGPPASRRRAG